MINIVAAVLYVCILVGVGFLSLRGKLHIALLFIIPLFSLRNVLERFQIYPLGSNLIDVLMLFMVLGWFLHKRHARFFVPTPLNLLLLLTILYTYVSLISGSIYLDMPLPIDMNDTRVKLWKNYMTFIVLFFLVVNNITEVLHMKWALLCMLVTMTVMDYYTLNQIRWMPDLLSRTKIDGTFVYLTSNEIAAFYAGYTFVLLGIWMMYKRVLIRYFYAFIILLNACCILFLYSRGAYVAVMLTLLVLAFLKKRMLLLPLLVFMIFWQYILPANVVDRIQETKTNDGQYDASAQTRLDIWKTSMEYFYQNPVMGIGMITIPFIELPGGLHDTHNVYVKILAEQGLIGMGLLLFLFLVALRQGWRLYRFADDSFMRGLGLGFVLCVSALMIANFFGDRWTHLQVGAYFWILLAFVVRGNMMIPRIACVPIPATMVPR